MSDRDEFLYDIMIQADVNGWAEAQWPDSNTMVLRPYEAEATTLTVTREAVETGLARIINGEFTYANPGYRRHDDPAGGPAARIAQFSHTNADESDADAWDFDAIVQAGIYTNESGPVWG